MAHAADAGSAQALAQVTRFAGEIKTEGVPGCRSAGHGRIEPCARGHSLGDRSAETAIRIFTCWIRPIRRRFSRVERSIDFRRTLFLVASKSGSTLEVNILKQYFFHRAVEHVRRR